MKFIILFLILVGCSHKIQNGFMPSGYNSNTNDEIIDESISGILLGNEASAVRVVGGDILDKRKSFNSLRLTNKKNSEHLQLIHHPGGKTYSFMEFFLSIPTKDSAHKIDKIENFKSSKGIYLGMSEDELMNIMGHMEPEMAEGKNVYKYILKEDQNSEFLKKINMPIYFGNYYFKENKLVMAHWGLEYP